MKIISYISGFMIPFLLFYVIGWGLLTKRDIYHDFLVTVAALVMLLKIFQKQKIIS